MIPEHQDNLEPKRIRGRVLMMGTGWIQLAQGSSATRYKAPLDIAPRIRCGNIVEAQIRGQEILAIETLTAYTRAQPFPSPGADYYRLHRDGLYERLLSRDRAWRRIRDFFQERDYLEVETPLRVRHPGLEPQLVVESAGKDRHLITSPEYHMKRLLSGGFERIFTICKCWRGDERGPLHLSEFTMLEWYRAYADTWTLMAETEALIRHTAAAVGGNPKAGGRELNLDLPFDRLSVNEACLRHGGVDIAGLHDAESLARAMGAAEFANLLPGDDFTGLFSRLMAERVEPALASYDAVFLHSYPAPVAALAALNPEDPTVADRFELYLGGVELANAFLELRDAEEQRLRFQQDQRARARNGSPTYSIDEAFIESLREGIPPVSGIALGLDRLLMVLLGASRIQDCVAFPPDAL